MRLIVGIWLMAALGGGALAVVLAQSNESDTANGRCEPAIFAEVAADLGIDFVHDRGATENRHNPETMGSGLAWLDFDGDGWWDLYMVQSGPFPPDGSAASANRLYRNLGGDRFIDVTEASKAADATYGQGVVAAETVRWPINCSSTGPAKTPAPSGHANCRRRAK